MPFLDTSYIPVLMAAGIIEGNVAGGTPAPISSNNGWLRGTTAAHPSTGVYTIALLQPMDPALIDVQITPLDVSANVVIDKTNANHPTTPSVTVYLTTP